MTRFVAQFAIVCGVFAAQVGNFWFTYGVWPQSWGSFAFFLLAFVCLHAAQRAIETENK